MSDTKKIASFVMGCLLVSHTTISGCSPIVPSVSKNSGSKPSLTVHETAQNPAPSPQILVFSSRIVEAGKINRDSPVTLEESQDGSGFIKTEVLKPEEVNQLRSQGFLLLSQEFGLSQIVVTLELDQTWEQILGADALSDEPLTLSVLDNGTLELRLSPELDENAHSFIVEHLQQIELKTTTTTSTAQPPRVVVPR